MLDTTNRFLQVFRNRIMESLAIWGLNNCPSSQHAFDHYEVNIGANTIKFTYTSNGQITEREKSWQDIKDKIPAIHSLFEEDMTPLEDRGKTTLSYRIPSIYEV